MDELSIFGIGVGDLTATGLLAIVVIMILLGRLVPLSILKEVRADRDLWRDIAQKALGTNEILANAAKENAEPTRTVAKVITAAQETLGVNSDGG